MTTLNEVYSSLSARRRYEVWFLRVGLADDSGAWWFRYLLLSPGRSSSEENSNGQPVQVWATWFPRHGKPRSFIQGFPLSSLELSAAGESPLRFRVANNAIGENHCCGALQVDGHTISWDLQYRSSFRVTLSSKGWIGFSRTPHSDALFSGHITLDGQRFEGDPLGFGVQGHNCGYRHRNFWTWAHTYFPRPGGPPSTFEALMYEMPFGLIFRKAVLWHQGNHHEFRNLQETKRDSSEFQWDFRCISRDRLRVDATIDGRGAGIHRLSYVKTDCKGSFEVTNNSLAQARLRITSTGGSVELLETDFGAVLEIVGR